MSELRRRLLRLEAPRRVGVIYIISDIPGDCIDQDPRSAQLSPVMTEAQWRREFCEDKS